MTAPRPAGLQRAATTPITTSSIRTTTVTTIAAVVLLTGCAGSSNGSGGTSSAPTSTALATSSASSSGPASTARPSGTPGTARGGLPDPRTVDGTHPEAVAAWVLHAWYGYDTRLDAGPSDAARRALPWLTPSLAAVVRQAAPIAAPGADWTQHARAHAYATVHLIPSGEDHPPDTALTIDRAYAVDITWHPATPAGAEHAVAFVHLSRPDLHSPWRVEEVMTR